MIEVFAMIFLSFSEIESRHYNMPSAKKNMEKSIPTYVHTYVLPNIVWNERN